MYKMIRNDVIKLERYVAAAFKYDDFLQRLFDCGGYVFFSQLKEEYGEGKARQLVKGAEEAKLINLHHYSKHKYISLASGGSKYLASKILGNREIVTNYKKIEQHPTEKKLFTSAIKWKMLELGRVEVISSYYKSILVDLIITDEKSEKNLRAEREIYVRKNYEKALSQKDIAQKLFKSEDEYAVNIGKQLAESVKEYRNQVKAYDEELELYHIKEKQIAERIKKGLDYFRISKIILLPEEAGLTVIIFDVGDIKSIAKYMENVKQFEKAYRMHFSSITFEFITHTAGRYSSFKSRVNKSKIYYPGIEIDLKPYGSSFEFIASIKESRDIPEDIIKEKDQDKFSEIQSALNK